MKRFIETLIDRFDSGDFPTVVNGPETTHGIVYGFDDEQGEVFATVGYSLPQDERVFAEIEDGTYGQLQGIRIYIPGATLGTDGKPVLA